MDGAGRRPSRWLRNLGVVMHTATLADLQMASSRLARHLLISLTTRFSELH